MAYAYPTDRLLFCVLTSAAALMAAPAVAQDRYGAAMPAAAPPPAMPAAWGRSSAPAPVAAASASQRRVLTWSSKNAGLRPALAPAAVLVAASPWTGSSWRTPGPAATAAPPSPAEVLAARGYAPPPYAVARPARTRAAPAYAARIDLADAGEAAPPRPLPTSIYASAAPASTALPPAPRVAAAGGSGPRLYSVHREFGMQPDAIPIPPQFFTASADLTAPVTDEPVRRTASETGTARVARVQSSEQP